MLCKLVNFSDKVSIAVSIQSMVFIAFERFWSIVLPMVPTVITARHSSRFVAFTWVFAVSIFFRYFFTHKLTYIANKLRCEHDWAEIFDTWEELWKVDRIDIFYHVCCYSICIVELFLFCYYLLSPSPKRKVLPFSIKGTENNGERESQSNRHVTVSCYLVLHRMDAILCLHF